MLRLQYASICAALSVLFTGYMAVAQNQTTAASSRVFIITSRDGAGIRIGPPLGVGPPANVLKALHTSARAARIDLRIVASPGRADCIVTLDLNEVHSGAEQGWTLIDARSGTLLQNGTTRSVRIAVHHAVRAIGRRCI